MVCIMYCSSFLFARITKEHGLKHISLITGGKTLVPGMLLSLNNAILEK